MSIDQNVSHPSHYGGKDNPYETIKVIDAWGLDKNFCLGNVIKYISRAGKKNENSLLQDLMKAQFYLNYEVEKMRKYDGNYEQMKAATRKAYLFDEKKKLVEDLDDLQSRFADLQADGVIDVNIDELIKAANEYKKKISNAYGCCDSEKYDCQPDECKTCKYSDDNGDADCKDCATRECLDGVHESYTETDECFTCPHCDDCGVHTISVPDDVGDAINTVADYFLDSEEDCEIGITDDGALVIAPADYDWSDLEDDDDDECD